MQGAVNKALSCMVSRNGLLQSAIVRAEQLVGQTCTKERERQRESMYGKGNWAISDRTFLESACENVCSRAAAGSLSR